MLSEEVGWHISPEPPTLHIFTLDSSMLSPALKTPNAEIRASSVNVLPQLQAQIGQVTLSDCLACSGCVTSAETVLLPLGLTPK